MFINNSTKEWSFMDWENRDNPQHAVEIVKWLNRRKEEFLIKSRVELAYPDVPIPTGPIKINRY